MSLSRATLHGRPLGLRGVGPWPCADLAPLRGESFQLASADPFLREAEGPATAYLRGSRRAWVEHPEYMDFLDPGSPVHRLKRRQRDLCLRFWGDPPGPLALDVGAGVGRFTMPLLDRGATVWAVDPDLASLRRLVWHAAGRRGRLDVARASAHHLPEVEVDLAVAAEVLCYVPDAVGALRGLAARVRPGGRIWLSVEARWGWAVAQDAPAGGLDAALGRSGTLELPERWVRTYDEADVRALVRDAGLDLLALAPSHYTLDGPLEALLPDDVDDEGIRRAEEAARAHPVFGPLNRLWLVTAGRPEGAGGGRAA